LLCERAIVRASTVRADREMLSGSRSPELATATMISANARQPYQTAG
jgi:hypothetical protein